jgi:hypothetical protein
VYHTQDGKTVFIDPKTNQATIFEGDAKLIEPSAVTAADQKEAVESILGPLPAKLMVGQFSVLKPQEATIAETDPLGLKEYYVLAPEALGGLSAFSAHAHIKAWVSEHKNGPKGNYIGHKKHRILPEQWDWLTNHAHCSIVAWYDEKCPAFITLGCQDHARIIRPVSKTEGILAGSEPKVDAELDVVLPSQEHLAAEEREI